MKIHIPTPLRQYAEKKSALDVNGRTVGEGLRIIIQIVSPDIDRIRVAGRGDVNVEKAREQRLAAERPVFVARDVRLAPAPAALVVAIAPAQVGQRRFQR